MTLITEKVVVLRVSALRRKALARAAAKGWTVAKFALRMGMNRQTLYRTLMAPTMTSAMWQRLNRVLGVQPEDWQKRRFAPSAGDVARDLMRGQAGKLLGAGKRARRAEEAERKLDSGARPKKGTERHGKS